MTKLSLENIKSNINRNNFKVLKNFDQLMGDKHSQLFVNYPTNKKEKFIKFNIGHKPNTLYIHIPFCTGICTYCAYVTKSAKIGDTKIDNYLDLLEKEFKLFNHMLGRLQISTAYIGGGTPTIMNLSQLNRLYKIIKKYFDISKIEEFTLEGCPETMSEDKISHGIDNGINRISIGVESFNNNILARMNRRHTSKQSIKTIEQAKILGIPIDIDIIRCYPGYTEEMVLDDVNIIANIRPNSITTYKYNLKPSSIDNKKNIPFLSETQVIEQTLLYYEGLKLIGYNQHNIDWFVNDNDFFKHQIYKWKYDANQIALGVGCYGYIGNTQYFTCKSMLDYKKKLDSNFLPIDYCQTLDSNELEIKNIMFALRDKVLIKNFSVDNQQKLKKIISAGLGYVKDDYFYLNQEGQLYIDQLQSYVGSDKDFCFF
tara:strand:+ start:355 stop:1635 length:1281 start_codon:yes stop_codon:yes gene_type:complete